MQNVGAIKMRTWKEIVNSSNYLLNLINDFELFTDTLKFDFANKKILKWFQTYNKSVTE